MNSSLQFDPARNLLVGPEGSLPIRPTDVSVARFLMLIEGECFNQNVAAVAEKFGCCRQRYYQLRQAFAQGGLSALEKHKTGPKSNYRRTDQTVRQVLRYLFLDPQASPEVVTQKLRQDHFPISLRSVQRIIADYGLQKKTLRAQPKKLAALAHAAGCQARSPRQRRPAQRGTGNPSDPGR